MYGDTFKYQFFGDIVVFTVNRDAVREVLVEKDFPKEKVTATILAFPLSTRFFGNGLFTELDNAKWRHRRAIFNPGFHRKYNFMYTFNHTAEILMDRLRLFADGKTSINLHAEMNNATLDAVAQIGFGMNTNCITDPDSKFSVYISDILTLIEADLKDPFMKFQRYKYPKLKNVKKMVNYLRETAREKLYERLKALENGEQLPNDILTNILTSYKDEKLDIECMVDDFITFYLAGQETTSNTLAFCFIELGRNFYVLEKLRDEVDRVLGKRSEITYQDIIELKYCAAVFKETLRLWPPLPLLPRKATEEITIDGYRIPKNTLISMHSYVSSRQEKYFKDALKFNPERFMKNSDESNFENYTYFPFSLGPRNCIGQNFGQIEAIVMIAKLIQRFDFKLDPNQSLHAVRTMTLKPGDGARSLLSVRT